MSVDAELFKKLGARLEERTKALEWEEAKHEHLYREKEILERLVGKGGGCPELLERKSEQVRALLDVRAAIESECRFISSLLEGSMPDIEEWAAGLQRK